MTDHRGVQGHHTITVFHRVDGAHEFPALDAIDVCNRFPNEWKRVPWFAGQAEHGRARRLPAGGHTYQEQTK